VRSGSAVVFQHFSEHDGRRAFHAVATQSDRSAEQLARTTTALAEEAFTTTRAFVDGMCRQVSSMLKIFAERWEVCCCFTATT
jgi:hypothetical protein